MSTSDLCKQQQSEEGEKSVNSRCSSDTEKTTYCY